ncbi:MAG: hypothetical protein AB8F95_02075 [Bacteroidia bacterium]
MAHHINIILAKEATIRSIESAWVLAHAIKLPQGFAMIPISIDLVEDMEELEDKPKTHEKSPLGSLPPTLHQYLLANSRQSEIAYIETEYFGGTGHQAAILYKDQNIALGPLITENNYWEKDSEDQQAINAILSKMGVWCNQDKDEFEMLGLGKWRSNEEMG